METTMHFLEKDVRVYQILTILVSNYSTTDSLSYFVLFTPNLHTQHVFTCWYKSLHITTQNFNRP